MNTWVALFRGINVGGHNVLPMVSLRQLLEANKCTQVQTVIQSGNVVFRSSDVDAPRVEARIAGLVAHAHGFEPRVLALSRAELQRAAKANPFPEAMDAPKSVHLYFLGEPPPKPDTKALASLRSATERFVLKGRVFYLHTPDGYGNSKLASRVERSLGVDATARNWRTVSTLVDLAASYP